MEDGSKQIDKNPQTCRPQNSLFICAILYRQSRLWKQKPCCVTNDRVSFLVFAVIDEYIAAGEFLSVGLFYDNRSSAAGVEPILEIWHTGSPVDIYCKRLAANTGETEMSLTMDRKLCIVLYTVCKNKNRGFSVYSQRRFVRKFNYKISCLFRRLPLEYNTNNVQSIKQYDIMYKK